MIEYTNNTEWCPFESKVLDQNNGMLVSPCHKKECIGYNQQSSPECQKYIESFCTSPNARLHEIYCYPYISKPITLPHLQLKGVEYCVENYFAGWEPYTSPCFHPVCSDATQTSISLVPNIVARYVQLIPFEGKYGEYSLIGRNAELLDVRT